MNGEGDGGRGTGPRPTNGNGAWPAPAVEPTEFRRRRNQQGTELHAAGMASSPPETASITHGAYIQDGNCMSCDKCPMRGKCEYEQAGGRCAIERQYIAHRRPQMMSAIQESGLDPTMFESLVDSAVWAELRCARAMRAAAVHGEFTWSKAEGHTYSGIGKVIPALQGAMIKALEALNLTPAAMLKLQAAQQRNTANAAAGVLAAALARQQGLPPGNPGEPGEESVDAEFSAAADGESEDGQQ